MRRAPLALRLTQEANDATNGNQFIVPFEEPDFLGSGAQMSAYESTTSESHLKNTASLGLPWWRSG